MTADWDARNTKWLGWLRWVSTDDSDYLGSHPELRDGWTPDRYWAVYLAPKPEGREEIVNGDLWVFVSKLDGNVIDWIPRR